MKRVILGVLIIVAVFVAAFLLRSSSHPASQEVLVICGGTMRAPLEAVIARYATVSGDRVLATYGDSGEIMAQIQNTGKGDVFVVHDPFMEWARQRRLVTEGAVVGYLDNVIVVPKGNPRGIRGVTDLAQPGLRLGVGDRRYSTSGVMVKQMLERVQNGAAIASNIVAEARSHGQRCTDVSMGTLDAAIVWSAAAKTQADKLEAIPMPDDLVDAVTSATYGQSDLRNVQTTMGLTPMGAKNEAARRFFGYATTQCADIFARYGFRSAKHEKQAPL